jgi:hypothetical protein
MRKTLVEDHIDAKAILGGSGLDGMISRARPPFLVFDDSPGFLGSTHH